MVLAVGGWLRLRGALSLYRSLCSQASSTPLPIRVRKAKSHRTEVREFIDARKVRALGGKGGDGMVSFLQLWANETAGPDGGDGGNGGHVLLKASANTRDLSRVESVLKAQDGEKGYSKDCQGSSASHTVVEVPLGTIVRDTSGKLIGELNVEGAMFILAKGGAGGHGNHFFATSTERSPKVAEYGAMGEDLHYFIEMRSIAHFGLVGLPNAGKSTLLQAVSRARPKVAPYPFTTLRPHLGIVSFTDYSRFSIADLPGIIEGSHKNRGLGLEFLRHAERCLAIVIVVDLGYESVHQQVSLLRNEIKRFSSELANKPQLLVANKIDLPNAKNNLKELMKNFEGEEIIAVSGKFGHNLSTLLLRLRELYDENHLSHQYSGSTTDALA